MTQFAMACRQSFTSFRATFYSCPYKEIATNFNAIFITFGILCVIGFITGGLLVPELGPKGELQQKANANK